MTEKKKKPVRRLRVPPGVTLSRLAAAHRNKAPRRKLKRKK